MNMRSPQTPADSIIRGMTEPEKNPIRVAMVEDDRVTREGLTLIINSTPGFACSRVYDSVEAFLRGAADAPPEVLLLDINLPGVPGSEGVRTIRERFPAVQVLMLTFFADEEKVFESICNGACGYLLKKTPPPRILEAIREALDGGAPMSPEIARKVVQLFQKTRPPDKVDFRLTPHEIRILGLLAEGYSYQSAAGRLDVSINTIRNYIRSIYDKLHVHSKSEAVSKALKSGLI